MLNKVLFAIHNLNWRTATKTTKLCKITTDFQLILATWVRKGLQI